MLLVLIFVTLAGIGGFITGIAIPALGPWLGIPCLILSICTMVSNLLVVLCGNKDAQPIINSGSLY